jgi:hypothetical protein
MVMHPEPLPHKGSRGRMQSVVSSVLSSVICIHGPTVVCRPGRHTAERDAGLGSKFREHSASDEARGLFWDPMYPFSIIYIFII